MAFGKLRAQAIEEQLQRAALGLPPARRDARLGPRRKRPGGKVPKPQAGYLAFSSCQHCGAIRVPNKDGKLPPHRCQA